MSTMSQWHSNFTVSVSWATLEHLWALNSQYATQFPLPPGIEWHWNSTATRNRVTLEFHCHPELSDTGIPLSSKIMCCWISRATRAALEVYLHSTNTEGRNRTRLTNHCQQSSNYTQHTLISSSHSKFKNWLSLGPSTHDIMAMLTIIRGDFQIMEHMQDRSQNAVDS